MVVAHQPAREVMRGSHMRPHGQFEVSDLGIHSILSEAGAAQGRSGAQPDRNSRCSCHDRFRCAAQISRVSLPVSRKRSLHTKLPCCVDTVHPSFIPGFAPGNNVDARRVLLSESGALIAADRYSKMKDVKDRGENAGFLDSDIDRRGFLKCMQWAGAGAKADVLRPRRARSAGRRRQAVFRAFWQGQHRRGSQSFEHKGVHFIGLNNSAQLEGLGAIGDEQLAWLKKDVSGLGNSTPIVVFAHIPLWAVYPEWGGATKDSAQALDLLKRFGSVTVLNGHIHQTLQKVEGNVTFYSAMSTAFPQPAPGTATAGGPMKVPAEQFRQVLGIRNVNFIAGQHRLAVMDSPLGSA